MTSLDIARATTRRRGLARVLRDQRRWTPYLFVAPFFATFAVFTLYPMLRAILMGFQESVGYSGQWKWVGLSNFQEALTRDQFVRISFTNMVYYTVGSLATQLPAAFLLALLLTSQTLWARGFFRTVFFIPAVLPTVTIGVVGVWLFSPSRGFVNEVWTLMGLNRVRWGMSPSHIMPMLLTMAFWQWMGNHAVFLIAGMSGIEPSLLEAALVDGATAWQRARYIILPLLRPVFAYISITAAAGSLVVFELPFIMIGTTGGAAGRGWFFIPYISWVAFDRFRMGYATAIGWLVFFLSIAVTIIQLRLFGYGEAK